MKYLLRLLLTTTILIFFIISAGAQWEYKYVSPKNANEMIDNLERFYDQVYKKIKYRDEFTEFEDTGKKLDEDIRKYENSLTSKQQKRFDEIVEKLQTHKDKLEETSSGEVYEGVPDEGIDIAVFDRVEVEVADSTAAAISEYADVSVPFAEAVVVDDNEQSYGPAHSEEDYLDKLDKIFSNVYIPAKSMSDIVKYKSDLDYIDSEKEQFYKNFTADQKDRYKAIMAKMKDKLNYLSTQENKSLKPSKYGPAKTAERFLNNFEKFYKDIISTATTLDIDEKYPNDFEVLRNDIDKYVGILTSKQKKRFEAIMLKVEKKEKELKQKDKTEVTVADPEPVVETNVTSDYLDGLLDRLEKFYDDYFDLVLEGKDANELLAKSQPLLDELQRVSSDFNSSQIERITNMAQKLSQRAAELAERGTYNDTPTDTVATTEEYSYDGLVPGEEVCETCAGNTEELLTNYEAFYDSTFSTVDTSDEALEYVNEMQVLQNDINRLESAFSDTEKTRFKNIQEKYKSKAEQIGLVIYPQSSNPD